MYFPTTTPNTRAHIGLPVTDLQRSLNFYQTLFAQEPTKTLDGYARFEIADPPLNLSLHVEKQPTGVRSSASHFGIQVRSTDSVLKRAAELEHAGLAAKREDQVTCCYAVQDKAWVSDPDGNEWEVFAVTDDGAEKYEKSLAGACCEDTCCSEAVT